MDSKPEILKFLSLPENIDVALEIAEYVERLKETTFQLFWEEFYLQIGRKIACEDSLFAWKSHNKRETEVGNWAIYSRIFQTSCPIKNLSLCLGVYVKEQLYWGVWKNQISDNDLQVPLFKDLELILAENKITNRDGPRWIAWGNYSRYRMQESKFLNAVIHQRDILVSEVVNDFWQLFQQCKPLMEQINQKVNINNV